MSILSSIFGGGKDKYNPMKEANKYLNQIPGIGHEGYDPYINSGLDAASQTKAKYESLMNDPTAFINELMKNYTTSEGYNFQKGQLTKELGNTAAAGGIAGTPLDQMNQGEMIQGLLGKDMQQFLANVLNAFGTGLTGEEGIASRGFDASKNLTNLLGGALNQQGGLAFQNAQQKNANAQANRNSAWNIFGKALGTGAGFLTGGPAGAVAGPMSGTPYSPWNNPG